MSFAWANCPYLVGVRTRTTGTAIQMYGHVTGTENRPPSVNPGQQILNENGTGSKMAVIWVDGIVWYVNSVLRPGICRLNITPADPSPLRSDQHVGALAHPSTSPKMQSHYNHVTLHQLEEMLMSVAHPDSRTYGQHWFPEHVASTSL